MKLAGIELLLLLLVYPFTNCANVTSKDSGNAENVPRGSLDRTSLNSTQGTKNDTNNLADILQNNISNQTDKAANQTTTQPTTLTPTTTTTLPPWKETPLHIGIMVPDALKDQCIQAAIELAFEDVGKHPRLIQYSGSNMERNNPTFIREYYKLTPYYSEVDLNISIAVQTLHDNYMKGPLKNALIGPPYERLQYDFIEYSSVLGGTHISYTDIDEPIEPYYVFFVPTPPSINHQFKAAVALMDHFQWRRFGILYDFSDSKYRRNSGTLRESILLYSQHKEETDVLTEIGIWSQKVDYSKLNQKMDILKKNDRRIILSLFSVRGARLVFCQAYHKKMYKPKIVWVLFEKLKDGWAKPLVDGTKDVNCTEGQLLEAAHGHIFITKQILRRDGVPNISNMTSNQFLKRIRQKVNSNKCSDDIGYAYDSIWVLAKGYEILSKSTWPRFYYYYNYAFGYLFAGTLKRINFEGLTGSFHYERDRSLHKRLGQIAFYKYHKDGNHVYLGTHHTKTGKLDIIPNMVYKIFNSDKIPKDKAIISYTYADIEKPLWITMWVIAFLGIIIALIVLVVILLYSNNTSYKIGSPILNCVMIFGAILCYTSVIIYSLDTRLVNEDKIPKVCFTFLCALTIGFTMTFGALFAKTWGLYKTFVTPPNHNNQQADIKHVPEWVLLTMVGAFLLIDIVLLISWGFMAPFHASLQVIYTNENFFADTVKTGQVVRCNCQYFIQLLIGLCCYKGVLLLIGIFLAWQLKSTKIQVQNEAKQIAIAIYNVFAVSIIGVICVSVLLNTKLHQALYAIVAICILICTTFTLLLVFVPKIKAILYPELEKPQPASAMKKEIYLRHSQRQYSRKQSHHRTSHTELSSTFSTGTLNTQLSVESTSTVYGKDTNQHPALQDTLSSGSVVSYPPEYLSSIPSSNNQSTILANIDEPITIEESNHVANAKDIQETRQERAITHVGHRDSGLGDDSPNLEHILLTLKDKEIQENKKNMEKDITNIGNPNDLGEDTSSLNLTPKSSDGMLDE